MPKEGTALEVKVEVHPNRVDREVRSAGSKPIIDYFNYLIDGVQQHLNRLVFPNIKTYLDETSRINTKGFIVAGVLSLVAACLAFCSAFLIL